jgi:hypothetical protein
MEYSQGKLENSCGGIHRHSFDEFGDAGSIANDECVGIFRDLVQ